MAGFDEKHFIDLTLREANHLKCSICLNIFNNAVIGECGHSFCKGCVQQWIQNKRIDCPNCKILFTRKRVRNNDNLIIIDGFVFKPNFTANGIISELKTKCQFNGCPKVVDFGLLSAHLKICEHRLCSNCGLIVGKPEVHNCEELLKKKKEETDAKSVDKNAGIKKAIERVIHAIQCKDTNCGLPHCSKFKRIVAHVKTCKRRTDPTHSCLTCKHMIVLCCFHAKTCEDTMCPIPSCQRIKVKQQHRQQQIQRTPVLQLALNLKMNIIQTMDNRS